MEEKEPVYVIGHMHPDTDGPYTLQKDILSRKMQILPKLTKVIEE